MCQYERLVVCGTTLEEATQRGPGLVFDIHNLYFHFQNQILIKIGARTCVLTLKKLPLGRLCLWQYSFPMVSLTWIIDISIPKPGIVFVLPFLETATLVDIRVKVFEVSPPEAAFVLKIRCEIDALHSTNVLNNKTKTFLSIFWS